MKTLPYIARAFHTNDPIYNAAAETLRASLDRFHLPYQITTIAGAPPGAGRWKAACRRKVGVIQETLRTHPDKDVLYLDADAVVLAYPVLFDAFPGDLGVVLRPNQPAWAEHPAGELFSCTIYIKNNERGRFLVDRWVEQVVVEESQGGVYDDQTMLQRVVDTYGPAGITAIPLTYAAKFAQPGTDAVIGQYQASRKVRAQAEGKPI